jgi:YfiH family protein
VDYGLSRGDAGSRLEAYASLGARLGFGAIAVGRQVHGTDVQTLDPGTISGLLLAGAVDGVATARAGLLLTATAADCVPVYLYDPVSGTLGLLHAGWRGTAGGILGQGIRALSTLGAARESLHLHLGPAICGPCYEVDTPVLRALGRRGDRAHIDLRAVLFDQARGEGIAVRHLSVSTRCTRCSDGLLHSHRGNGSSAGRMAAYLGRKAARTGEEGPTR